MDSQNIGISQFADSCMIPRPTMSQILNGRNKKISDDLITKVHVAYPDLSISWLMFNEGPMMISENTQISSPQKAPSPTQGSTESNADQAINRSHNCVYNALQNNTEKNSGAPMPKEIESHDGTPTREGQYIDFGFGAPISDASPEAAKDETQYGNQTSGSITRADIPFSQSDEPDPSTVKFMHNDDSSTTAINTSEGSNNESSESNKFTPGTTNVTINTSPLKKITNIVVFYSDNSFQSFGPA